MATYTLSTLRTDDSEFVPALEVAGNRYFLTNLIDRKLDDGLSLKQLLENWQHWEPLLQSLADSIDSKPVDYTRAIASEHTTVVTPIRYPDKLLAVGANYASHLLEMGLPAEKWNPMPFFSCPPSTTIVGPGATVKYPRDSSQFDWECELVVIVGKALQNASTEEATEAIAGYTIGLDLSCRDLLAPGNGGLVDLMRGKAQDTMKPCGPTFVPKSVVKNHNDLPIKLHVNGELMIDGNTADMIWKPEECLAEISKVTKLESGDMVMTGTPAGSASSHGGRYLKVGDVISAEIGQLGVLEVVVTQ